MYPHIHTSLQIAGVAASWETLSQPYIFVQIAQGQPPDIVIAARDSFTAAASTKNRRGDIVIAERDSFTAPAPPAPNN